METVVPDTLATASAGMNQQNIVLPSELDTEMKKCKEGERGPAHDGQEGGWKQAGAAPDWRKEARNIKIRERDRPAEQQMIPGVHWV